MKREIKFRMWLDGEMQQAAFKLDMGRLMMGMATHPDAPVVVGLDTLIPAMQANGAVLMQFTGLKDKNGREIYEGDVVTVVHGLSPIPHDNAPTEWVEKPMRKEVPLMGTIRGFEWLGHYGRNTTFLQLTVIGNIHENPELLKP